MIKVEIVTPVMPSKKSKAKLSRLIQKIVKDDNCMISFFDVKDSFCFTQTFDVLVMDSETMNEITGLRKELLKGHIHIAAE